MPLYDFSCPACGACFEAVVSVSRRNDPHRCECGEVAHRELTGGKFMLIGGGWSGVAHPVVIPPQTDPNAKTGWRDNYYKCTPESVRKTLRG